MWKIADVLLQYKSDPFLSFHWKKKNDKSGLQECYIEFPWFGSKKYYNSSLVG